MKTASTASVAVALFLIALKTFALLETHSVAVLSGLTDSLLDFFASCLNFWAVKQSLEPADKGHRFGHGKIEALSSTGQAAFIAGSAFLLMFQAIDDFSNPREVQNSVLGMSVMGISIIVTFVLICFQRYVVKKTGSVAVSADYAHYAGDVFLNLSIIASLLLGYYFNWRFIDPLFALFIAIYLLLSAVGIWKKSFLQLTDAELDHDTKQRILQIVRQNTDVLDVHDFRTRASGTQKFVQMHLEMNPLMTLFDAHAVADAVEEAIIAEFPETEVLIHEDPSGLFENHSKLAYDLN